MKKTSKVKQTKATQWRVLIQIVPKYSHGIMSQHGLPFHDEETAKKAFASLKAVLGQNDFQDSQEKEKVIEVVHAGGTLAIQAHEIHSVSITDNLFLMRDNKAWESLAKSKTV